MTEDDKKKKAIVESAKPTELTPEDTEMAFDKMKLRMLLFDAMRELNAAAQAGRPLVICYRVPCPCGKPECTTKLAVSITPYTEIVYDSLRSKH